MNDGEIEVLRSEVIRLENELEKTNHQNVKAAELGLLVLEEKQLLQKKIKEVESAFEQNQIELNVAQETLRRSELQNLKQNQESASEEESRMEKNSTKIREMYDRLKAMESENKALRNERDRVTKENEELEKVVEKLHYDQHEREGQREKLLYKLKDMEKREIKILADISELEDENIGLQKQVVSYRINQMECESLRLELESVREQKYIHSQKLEESEMLRAMLKKQLEETTELCERERHLRQAAKLEVEEIKLLRGCTNTSSFLPNNHNSHKGSKRLRDKLSDEEPLASEYEDYLNMTTNAELTAMLLDEDPSLLCGMNGTSSENDGDLFNEMHASEMNDLRGRLDVVVAERDDLASQLTRLRECHKPDNHATTAHPPITAPRSVTVVSQGDQVLLTALQNDLERKSAALYEREGDLVVVRSALQGILCSLLPTLISRVSGFVREPLSGSAELGVGDDDITITNPPNVVGGRRDPRPNDDTEDDDYDREGVGVRLAHAKYERDILDRAHERGTSDLDCDTNHADPATTNSNDLKRTNASVGDGTYEPQGVREGVQQLKAELKGLEVLLLDKLLPSISCHHRHRELPVSANGEGGGATVGNGAAPSHSDSDASEGSGTINKQQHEHLLREIQRLKAIVVSKRSKNLHYRSVLQSYKTTAEVCFSKMQAKYTEERRVVSDTLSRYRKELGVYKDDCLTLAEQLSSLRNECRDLNQTNAALRSRVDFLESERKTLNSMLKTAIHQKFALIQKVESLECFNFLQTNNEDNEDDDCLGAGDLLGNHKALFLKQQNAASRLKNGNLKKETSVLYYKNNGPPNNRRGGTLPSAPPGLSTTDILLNKFSMATKLMSPTSGENFLVRHNNKAFSKPNGSIHTTSTSPKLLTQMFPQISLLSRRAFNNNQSIAKPPTLTNGCPTNPTYNIKNCLRYKMNGTLQEEMGNRINRGGLDVNDTSGVDGSKLVPDMQVAGPVTQFDNHNTDISQHT